MTLFRGLQVPTEGGNVIPWHPNAMVIEQGKAVLATDVASFRCGGHISKCFGLVPWGSYAPGQTSCYNVLCRDMAFLRSCAIVLRRLFLVTCHSPARLVCVAEN